MRTSVSSLFLGAALLLGAHSVYAADALRPEVGEPLQKAQALMQSKQYKQAMEQVDIASHVGGLTAYESGVIAQVGAPHAPKTPHTAPPLHK
jgi:hypothetical protein